MNVRGDRIRAERRRRGWRQEDLGRRAGCSRSIVADLENGRNRESTKLPSIAKALGVSLTWLETGRGRKTPLASSEAPYVSADSLEDVAEQMLSKGPDEVWRLVQLLLTTAR
ncbi:helix-turn-helix domain-containing protein [Chromobacterium violaceum]|uniref:helix-turn-helix domain-containing protein n=1 Tax=Chromobacterium violaceum TaxID=536 RepID=UPI001C8CBF97|nr:helix-turn-helix transcriptional regulator [Chromobacterium violaceum]MBX9267235.1 helix-turn-helix transcriptional regulator [Chromobacterium violaceum]